MARSARSVTTAGGQRPNGPASSYSKRPALRRPKCSALRCPVRPLPVIGVNRKLRPNGRTFTLLHECVHIFLEQSSICDIDEGMLRPPEEQRVEVFCNAVAGAALVPFELLLSEPLVRAHPPRPRDWSGEELARSAVLSESARRSFCAGC